MAVALDKQVMQAGSGQGPRSAPLDGGLDGSLRCYAALTAQLLWQGAHQKPEVKGSSLTSSPPSSPRGFMNA